MFYHDPDQCSKNIEKISETGGIWGNFNSNEGISRNVEIWIIIGNLCETNIAELQEVT